MTTHDDPRRQTWPRAAAACALIAAFLIAAPATAAGLPRARSLPRAFPLASPIVDGENRVALDVPGYRGLPTSLYDAYEFAALCAVLTGVSAVLGIVLTSYALQQDDPMWDGSAGLAWSMAGTWGTMGSIAGIRVETHRNRSYFQIHATPRGPSAELQFGPSGFSMRF